MPKRHIGPWGAYALCLGAAVGVTIFGVVGQAFALAGPALLVSLVIAAIPFYFWTTNKAFLASAVPTDGASYAWTARFIHPYVGFIITWLVWIGDVMALVLLPFVLYSYFSALAFMNVKIFIAIILAIFFVLNVLGIRITTVLQVVLVFLMLALMAVFIVTGLGGMHAANFAPFAPSGWWAVIVAATLLIGLYEGIADAIEVGDEVSGARKTLPRVLYLGLSTVVVLAGLLFLVSVGVQGKALIPESAPILSIAGARLGAAGSQLIILPAVALAILTTVNAIFIASSRRVFGMARDGLLPKIFAHVHPRFGTPDATLATVFVGGLIALFLPLNILLLVLGVVVPGLLRYAGIALSVLVVSLRRKDIMAKARLKISMTWLQIGAVVGVVAALVFIVAGISASALSYEILLGWAILGTIWFLAHWRKGAVFTPRDLESGEAGEGA